MAEERSKRFGERDRLQTAFGTCPKRLGLSPLSSAVLLSGGGMGRGDVQGCFQG